MLPFLFRLTNFQTDGSTLQTQASLWRGELTRGRVSVYFRDPDDHLLEIATLGLWKGY
jgi:catechol 2,3-dioxygenase-like lactoylglutathione lyase family enzyme